MGQAMALAATAKAADNGLGVGFWMAFLAGRNSFMPGGMAFGT